MKRTTTMTMCFTTRSGKRGTINVSVKEAKAWRYRITRTEAIRLLREYGYDLSFDIMCKEYGQGQSEVEPDDWCGVDVDDLHDEDGEECTDENRHKGTLWDDYKTFEVTDPFNGNFKPC